MKVQFTNIENKKNKNKNYQQISTNINKYQRISTNINQYQQI